MNTYCKIIAIAKNEAAYIPQWIAHHLYFGFSEIEVWINGTTDNSIEILTKISEKYPNVKFKNADEALNQCLSNGENFQVYAYQQMLLGTEQSGISTHLMCLDLDELWTPKDFATTIDTAIKENSADAISFQWHLDTPDDQRVRFSRPFQASNTLQKNRHVKTLAKLGDKKTKVNIHNFDIEKGNYSLQDGSEFEETDTDQHRKAKVSTSFFNNTKFAIDNFFIVHQIYRSCDEYIASLSRGRNHAGDEQPIKVNRDGYILEPLSHHGLVLNIPNENLNKYDRHFEKFVSETKINKEIQRAQEFVEQKFLEVTSRVKQSKDFYLRYRNQFKGTKLNDRLSEKVPYSHIIYHVDQNSLDKKDGSKTLTGWAFDTLSNQSLTFLPQTNSKIVVTKLDRPDVQKIHQDAPLDCGFKILITYNNPPEQSAAYEKPSISLKSEFSTQLVEI